MKRGHRPASSEDCRGMVELASLPPRGGGSGWGDLSPPDALVRTGSSLRRSPEHYCAIKRKPSGGSGHGYGDIISRHFASAVRCPSGRRWPTLLSCPRAWLSSWMEDNTGGASGNIRPEQLGSTRTDSGSCDSATTRFSATLRGSWRASSKHCRIERKDPPPQPSPTRGEGDELRLSGHGRPTSGLEF